MATNIKRKTVIVTGGATGLGYAVAEKFLEQGDVVVLNGRTESKLQTAAQQLGQSDRVAIVAGRLQGQRTNRSQRERPKPPGVPKPTCADAR